MRNANKNLLDRDRLDSMVAEIEAAEHTKIRQGASEGAANFQGSFIMTIEDHEHHEHLAMFITTPQAVNFAGTGINTAGPIAINPEWSTWEFHEAFGWPDAWMTALWVAVIRQVCAEMSA